MNEAEFTAYLADLRSAGQLALQMKMADGTPAPHAWICTQCRSVLGSKEDAENCRICAKAK